ncbi:MAG: M48 family metallopeptidase [Phycisphaerae bacterium]
MYFVVILAFALVLSDTLPPRQCNLFAGQPLTRGLPLFGTLAVIAGQFLIVWALAWIARRKTLARLDGTGDGHDAAADTYAFYQQVFLFVLAGGLVLTMVFTPWAGLVRAGWGLGRFPLVGDLLLLMPFFGSLLLIWTLLFPVEQRLRAEAIGDAAEPVESPNHGRNAAIETLGRARHASSLAPPTLFGYLLDKVRHQLLILAVPMSIIVLAKHLIENYAGRLINLPADRTIQDIILNGALGTVSVIVLAFAPVMMRYIWATEPLPAGKLRERFASTCKRIGLRYREILLWHTHGTAVNAAVMGFVAPLRYILISDALLETMDEDEIEAVFGHEAGHVRHWHLPFFGVFAVVSMYAAGGAMYLLFYIDRSIDPGILQLVALSTLLAMWLFGFSWLSRKFERQADLFSVRCVTPDIRRCVAACPVHGERRSAGLCISAANLFGRTLGKIADLNGIPREAPSWRHGSIESRCRLIESFATDNAALVRFDRKLLRIKIGLIVIALVASGVALWLYRVPLIAQARRLGWL